MPISKRKKMLVVVIVLGSVCALFTVFVIRGMVSMQVENVPVPALKDISLPVWAKLSRQRMYFGHQSVGNNIIDGLQDIRKEHPEINLNIIETSDPQRLHMPALAHSKVGTNKDPKSKLDAFADLMAKGMADNVQNLLNEESPVVDQDAADTAIFYSITNAQKGLSGISLGNFLIKWVVSELSSELKNLKVF